MPEVRVLGVLEAGAPGYLSEPEAPLADGEARLETVYSGISAGTELTFVKGTNPYLHARWDKELGVFRTDRPAEAYPVRRLGYMEVGRVVESRAAGPEEGTLVAAPYGHRTRHALRVEAERWLALPEELDPVLGVLVAHMGPICANGLLHAAAELRRGGDVRLSDGVRGLRVLVSGAGVVGLLVGLFARAHGAAEVAVADVDARRLAAAAGLGLVPVDDSEEPAWSQLKGRWRHGPGDRGAEVAFQCRGRDEALAGALRALRPQGTLIDLAFYQGGAGGLRLGEEFHHNGLGIRCAQIGRVPRGLAGAWSRERLQGETLALLLEHGDAVREHLVTDLVPFEKGADLLSDLAARRRQALLAVLDFSRTSA